MADDRGCGGAGCILAREAGGQVVGVCRCLPRELAPEDRSRLYREIGEQRAELLALRAIVEGRTTGPTDAEIDAHAARGGSWIVTQTNGAEWGTANAGRVREMRDFIGGRGIWLPMLRGRPCAWPEVSRG